MDAPVREVVPASQRPRKQLTHEMLAPYSPPKGVSKVDARGQELPERHPLRLPDLPPWQNIDSRPDAPRLGGRLFGGTAPMPDKVNTTSYHFVLNEWGQGSWSVAC